MNIEKGNFNKALGFINNALELRQNYNFNPVDIAHSYKSLSELYYKWNMQEKGDYFLLKTDSINQLIQSEKLSKYKYFDDLVFKLSENYVGNCYEYKGDYLLVQKRYNQALEAYNLATKYYGEFTFQKVSLINKKANVYYNLSDYINCLKSVEECIQF